jgi:hypothetical protein
VVSAATALGQVEPQDAGVASGIVSTFHEFGASLGAAVVSSVAAASIVGRSLDGFTDGFTVAAVAAAGAAVLTGVITPRRGWQPGHTSSRRIRSGQSDVATRAVNVRPSAVRTQGSPVPTDTATDEPEPDASTTGSSAGASVIAAKRR